MNKCECKNCVHEEVCNGNVSIDYFTSKCDHYKDKSLIVELPCKVGQTVYIIDDYYCVEISEPYVLDVKVLEIHYDKNGVGLTLELPLGIKQIGYFKLNKTVFLTKEDAEAKLKEIEGK